MKSLRDIMDELSPAERSATEERARVLIGEEKARQVNRLKAQLASIGVVFPDDMLDRVDQHARAHGLTPLQFVIQAVDWATALEPDTAA